MMIKPSPTFFVAVLFAPLIPLHADGEAAQTKRNILHLVADDMGWTALRCYGKLVLGPRTELYHLADDLSETRDLAAARPEKTRELRAALEAWWQDTGAGFPTKNPGFDEARWWITNDQTAGKRAKAAAPPQD